MQEIKFDSQAAVESILYLTRRLKSPTVHEVLKLRYFADKLHMSRYGFIASGDDYVAMNFGPVASRTYDILKAARGEKGPFIKPVYFEATKDALRIDGDDVFALRDANEDLLSRADIECLGEAIQTEGNKPFGTRTQRSHDQAWDRAWKRALESGQHSREMPLNDIAKTLENSEDVLKYMAG
jgi:hypothetical protein